MVGAGTHRIPIFTQSDENYAQSCLDEVGASDNFKIGKIYN